jgi:hypothetical protein
VLVLQKCVAARVLSHFRSFPFAERASRLVDLESYVRSAHQHWTWALYQKKNGRGPTKDVKASGRYSNYDFYMCCSKKTLFL